ncbi:MAG TPA: hypothetical protein VEX86_19425 [Longimicrobium sp.]|nr:hypothetical protein [Longimicrobium sp.]
MKLRAITPLLALALTALSACEGRLLLPSLELVGSWGSDRETVRTFFPEGERMLDGENFLSFQEDGDFVMQVLLTDPQRGRLVVESIDRGSYTIRDGRAQLTTTARYLRGAGEPASDPAVLPVAPFTVDYQYEVDGITLTFVPVCPPNAQCVAPRFTRYRSLRVD